MASETITRFRLKTLADTLDMPWSSFYNRVNREVLFSQYRSEWNAMLLTDEDLSEIKIASNIWRRYRVPFYMGLKMAHEGWTPPKELEIKVA